MRTEAIRRLKIEGSTSGVKEATDQLSALARAQTTVAQTADGMAVSTDKSAKRQLSAARDYDGVRARVDDVYRSQLQFQKMQGIVDKAFNQGAIGAEEYARTSQLVSERFKQNTQNANDNAKAVGLARHEMINLGRQAQDVGTMLAMGASPMQVFTSQAAQVFDIFSSSQGTMKGFFGQVTSGLSSVFTLGRVAFGGIVTGAGAAVLALNSYLDSQKEVQRSLSGIGRASGLTAGGINSIASASASPLGFSVSEAREFATAIVSTGRVGRDELSSLVKLGHDFSKALGVDGREAAQTLAGALSDPVRGADQLNQRLGFMDAAQRRNIQNLVEQNRIAEAQRVIIAGIQSSIESASNATGFWSKTWTAIANAVSNTWDGLGNVLARATGVGQTLDDQYATAKARLLELQKIREAQSGDDAFSAAARRVRGGVISDDSAKYNEAVANEQRLAKALQDRAAAAEATRQRMASLQIASTALDFLPEVRQLDQLKNSQDLLVRTMIDVQASGGPASEVLKRIGLSYEQLAAAIAKANAEIKDFATQNQRAAAQAKIAQDAVTAYSPGARADIARRSAVEQNRGNPEAEARGQEAYTLALRQANEGLREQARERKLASDQSVQSANLELELVGKGIAAQTAARMNLQAKQQLEQDAARNRVAFDEAEYQRLKRNNEEIAKKAQLRAVADATGNAQFQRDTLFMSPVDQQVAGTMRTLYGDEWQSHMDDALAKQMRMNALLMEAHGNAQQFTGDFVRGLMSGKSVMESLANAAQNLSAKMADKAIMSLFSGDFVSAGIQGAIAAGSALFANDQKQKKAREEWAKTGPAFEAFIETMTGSGVAGKIRQAMADALRQTNEYVRQATEAGDRASAIRAQEAYNANAIRLQNQFSATFNATLRGLSDAIGMDSPFLAAVDLVKKQLNDMQSFIDDTKVTFNNDATMVAAARGATQDFMVSLLAGARELSKVETELLRLEGTSAALQGALVDLGMSAEQAAAEIAAGMTAAIQKLRAEFEQDVWRDLNDVSGKGYVNEIGDLIAKTQARLQDAARLGYSADLINLIFQRTAQQIVDSAGLTGTAFQELVTLFPQLQGAVTEFTGAAEEEAKRLAEEAKRAAEQWANFLSGLSRNIREFIDGIRGGGDLLSPANTLSSTQSAFNSQYALAVAGDRDAANGITQYAQRAIDALKAMYGSASPAQAGIEDILTRLGALPGQISDAQYIVNAISDMKSALSNALQTGSPAAIAQALLPSFNTLTATTGGLLSYSQFASIGNGLASNATLQAMFNALDANGDGQINQLELIKGTTNQTQLAVNTSNSAYLDNINKTLNLMSNNQNTSIISLLTGIAQNTASSAAQLVSINTGITYAVGSQFPLLGPIRDNLRHQNIKDQISNFWTGGYTGAGGKYDVAGTVHRGEYVFDQAATRAWGVQNLDMMARGAMPVQRFSNDNVGMHAMALEIRELRKEVAAFRQENTRATVAAAEHVGGKVDGLSETIDEGQREARMRAA